MTSLFETGIRCCGDVLTLVRRHAASDPPEVDTASAIRLDHGWTERRSQAPRRGPGSAERLIPAARGVPTLNS